MLDKIYIDTIASRLQVKDWQVENCLDLFADGATVPFISRYRKEKTGGLSDVEVSQVKHFQGVYEEMAARKETIRKTIAEAGALTPELDQAIANCVESQVLEDLYLPYRPKKRTRATVAKEKGLEPLAQAMLEMRLFDPEKEALRYVKPTASGRSDAVAAAATAASLTAREALDGAKDIIAENLSERASVREMLREVFRHRRVCAKATKAAAGNPEADKYRSYFNFSESLQHIAPHRLLAILRAEEEGFLNLEIDADPEKSSWQLYMDLCKDKKRPSQALANELRSACDDAYKRLLEPSISRDILKEAKEKADIASIAIFGDNLKQLLLAAPVGQKRLLAIDPGFRTGCKCVCLDAQGNLLYHTAIFPHPPQNEKVRSIQAVSDMLEKYKIEVIAIGSGTAGRETGEFIKRVPKSPDIKVFSVSEDGASVYSASEVGREEFPEQDVTVRGAVSIGRRLMDPLAELVKIDPKSLGVGQYQHDVDQKLLKEKLDETVEYCVNAVGVNVNTASPYLLSYVSGVGPALARNIVAYRVANGDLTDREQLRKVPRLGDKAFQQCAAFLRIKGGKNPLDASAVHPEAYPVVEKMAAGLGVSTEQLVGNESLCQQIKPEDYVSEQFGLPTLNDILKELKKPGLDPREEASEFAFADDIRDIEDLKTGMELPGIVTNVTAFGAFVDIGLHENGLIHASQMGVKGLAVPSQVLKLHQKVRVTVLNVDLERRRIGLRLVK
ncbi:MAG: RNA-binding transcriptional accessory protein [Bacteroidales bacterium]|nr:RNA-binding transcriptional accessory protein [Bacteroidales bacterium]